MQFVIKSKNSSAVLGLDGAQLNSLKKNDTEYLWQGDKKYWAGQAPVCFPIVGVLPDGKAKAFGKTCNVCTLVQLITWLVKGNVSVLSYSKNLNINSAGF